MLILAFIGLIGMQVYAQKIVTGTVTADDGATLPGVSVSVKGTSVGTVTDFNGKYSLNVPAGDQYIIFSFVGMTTQQLPATGSVVNCTLASGDIGIDEVVVTALGISREKKSLGYSVQEVGSEDVLQVGQTNVLNSLSGKVSGVNITGSSGNMGGSSRILIRGASSATGNNQPLFVIDGTPMDNSDFNSKETSRGAGGIDYGNMAQDINANDIASISVLKGANAAALYGSRAANGVIVITTKKGASGKKGIGVSYNGGVSFDKVAILPTYQNLYGGGYGIDQLGYTDDKGYYKVPYTDGDGNEFQSFDLIPNYDTDESKGPAYATTAGDFITNTLGIDYVDTKPIMYRKWNSWDEWDTEHYGKSEEWKTPVNDVGTFFNTGVTYTNSVGLQGGNENSLFRLSYTNLNSSGYMPNSTLKRNTISFNGSTKLGENLNAFAVVSYVKTDGFGRPETGYGDRGVMERFNQWGQRQLDMEELSHYLNPDGTQRTWNRIGWDEPTPAYSDNPYWSLYENYQNDTRDRIFGNAGFTYEIFDGLSFTGKFNLDNYAFKAEERIAIGSQAQSYYTATVRNVTEVNNEFLFAYDKPISDKISLNALFGGNNMNRKYYRLGSTTSGGLLIADLYNLSNSTAPYLSDDYKELKKVNSLYGSASVGFSSMVYIDATLRNDWSSTLPAGNNSYLYPSVTGSLIISQLGSLKDLNWLSFLKLRGGWASVGNDTNPYNTSVNYINLFDANSNPYQFGADAMFTLPGQLNNKELLPENTKSTEFGLEGNFFQSRIGFDVTYYSKSTTNQIIPVAVSASSGFATKLLNAGEITNKGLEVMFYVTPVSTKNINWDITINWSKNQNKVVSLYPGVDAILLSNAPFKASVNAKVGEKYGAIMGTDFLYDAQGHKVVGANGRYLSSAVKTIGNVLPDWNAGISNKITFFGVSLNALVDFQKGGSLFSTTYMWGMYSGILEESAAINELGNNIRDEVIENEDGTYDAKSGGVIIDAYTAMYDDKGNIMFNDANSNGVLDEGETIQTEKANDVRLDGLAFDEDHYNGPAAQSVFNTDYIKLRELSLSYTFPAKMTRSVQNLQVGVFGRNLATWGTSIKHIDVETVSSSGNVQGLEGGALPSLKTFGFNLSFNF